MRPAAPGIHRSHRYGADHPAEETAAWQSAGQLYFGWLMVGAASFALLRMPKTLLAHVSTMLLSPIALFVLLLLLASGLD
ncbi:hypothetical protein Smic_87590 [Streptomyces microflavus]|uniref:Uncharacterized protein n=1 Tax=Streptomyces microflavus TaxID=1919 RepID=A0A7J0D624_STRMI|nr:hypothetical protein Smic_87590 [Streptomyces microflavus]